jgi:hypothetical protein
MLTLSAVSLLFGALSLLAGLVVMPASRRLRKRILRTPTSPITQAPGGCLVEIQGCVLPSELGIIRAPFSGRPAVWAHIRAEQERPEGNSYEWHTIIDETTSVPFLVDDGSGECARVIPQDADVHVGEQCVATSGTHKEPPPHVQEFLRERGLTFRRPLDFAGVRPNTPMRFHEQVLAPGDRLYAIGPSRRAPGPPVAAGYRSQTSTVLFLSAGDGPKGELILTTGTEEELLSSLNWWIIPISIGAILTLAGIVMVLRGP